ncbi:MAG: response regulator transcription factor [Actinobacteria bacterium]|nr:response regulator transcription factor [Actinomycetota bacterium]MBW3650757.1 response regulator transcription factor [Actinomycetota bacterium]
MSIRVLLADDHTMVRQSMRRSMEAEGFQIVGEAADGEEAVRLALELTPDVVLMDISMPVLDGVEATRQVRRQCPATQVVVLTMHADADLVRRALQSGAAGYLTKDCSVDEVAEAVRLAASGDVAVSGGLAAALLHQAASLPDEPEVSPAVTAREVEVLQLIAEGASPPEVAEKLFISVSTVKNHLSSIYEKLDARDRTQAVVKALRMGVIRLD